MPRPLVWIVRGLLACALVSSTLLPTEASEAQRPRYAPVAIRDVRVVSNRTLEPPLRAAMEEALAAMDVVSVHPTPQAGYVLDASITQLETESMTVGRRIDCEVSIVVEDARRHAVRGVLTGRAHVIGDAGPALELAAVRAAARGAIRSLPTAIAR